MLKAMNSVNSDLQFSMEICKDFEEGKLPTLSFSNWPEENGLMHTYFEKIMRNQILSSFLIISASVGVSFILVKNGDFGYFRNIYSNQRFLIFCLVLLGGSEFAGGFS